MNEYLYFMTYVNVKSAVKVYCEAVARIDFLFTWLWLLTSPYFYSLERLYPGILITTRMKPNCLFLDKIVNSSYAVSEIKMCQFSVSSLFLNRRIQTTVIFVYF